MGLLDALRAALAGDPKKGTDELAGPGTPAGTIKNRRDAALRIADDIDNPTPPSDDERRRAQHSDHNN